MTRLHELAALGQAPWLDFIARSLLGSGQFQELLDQGILGVTSNPTIFERAISAGADYDEQLRSLSGAGKTTEQIYEALVLEDITRALDTLRPLYHASHGLHGYVSLEVNPHLAHDTEGTILEARRFFHGLGRPNLFIKVPATREGIRAIRTLIAEGINVNVTLMFSLAHYEAVAEAYIAGLEQRVATGGDVSLVASVASFFVSRVDTAVDKALEKMGRAELQGKIAVANTKLAYACFRRVFSGPRWGRLAACGARVQRPLWASTGSKNPAYPDTLYVDTLIGADTVNTMPLPTIAAFLDHGQVALTVDQGVEEARLQVGRLAELGVDLDAITERLQDEGVAAFVKSYDDLLSAIVSKARSLADAQ